MKNKDCNRGFTLVELLITVAILGIIVAPFLATFVTASTNNVKSSTRQQLSEAAEDLAEEFKAKSLDLLDDEYAPTYNATFGEYTFDISASRLKAITSYGGKGYKAEVKLTPSTSVMNGEIPTLVNMKTDYTMLFMQGFYSNDKDKSGYRNSTISIDLVSEGGVDKYKITLKVGYNGAPETEVSSKTFEYNTDKEPPAIYAVYVPKSTTDRINIKIGDSIEASDWPDLYDDEGDPVTDASGNTLKAPMQIYFVVQGTTGISSSYFDVDDGSNSGNVKSYVENDLSSSPKLLDIHTNAYDGGSILDTTKENNIYDITVDIIKGSDVVATYKSSKINFD